MVRFASLCLVLFALGACADAPGDACEASGEGFTRQDSCGGESRCLSFPVTCPDGDEVTPNVCEGGECASDDDCDAGWVCVETGSTTSNCVPAEVCGA